MEYNKLVRDRIPEIIKEAGRECVYRVADEKEYYAKLRDKLREEVEEFLEDPCLEEAADILEVLEAILSREKYRSVRAEQIAKRVTRGGFEKRIILESVKD